MVKVSVIMPAYNVEKYLEQAIFSCLNQTLKNIEIIIVNDGSTDRTGEIARKLSREHSNIIYIETTNQGLSMARNNGMKVAKGEYIYFLDSDDWIEEECLKQSCDELDKYALDFVTFDSNYIYENENGSWRKQQKMKQGLNPNCIYNGVEIAEKYIKKGGMSAAVWKNVYRRTFLTNSNLSFIPGLYYEDNPFQLKVCSYAQKIKYIPLELHNYRIREKSIMTSQMSIKKIESSFFIANYFFDFLEQESKNVDIWKSYVAVSLSGIWLCNFGGMSAKDLKNIEPYEKLILNRKDALISRIYKIYNNVQRSLDDIRNMCKLMEIIVLTLSYKNVVQEKMLVEILEENKKYTTEILKTYPLHNKQKKIGIYGSGVNADYILKLYEQYIGKVRADIIFIDSKVESYTQQHNGLDVINVKDLKKTNVEEIIILSFIYEQEMYETIYDLYGKEYPIHRFYMNGLANIERTSGELYFFEQKLRKDEKHIILACTPSHTNIGDNLITKGEYVFLQKKMPEYQIVEITQEQYIKYRGLICAALNKKEKILICGGGFLGSLWENELTVVEYILQDFCNQKIVILPQSIFYEDSEYGNYRKKIDKQIFSMQRDLTICFREAKSLERFYNMEVENVKTKLVPDMALAIGDCNMNYKRNGIIFCFRDDKECIVEKDEKEKMKKYFEQKGASVHEESMLNNKPISASDREMVIRSKLESFARSALVITDRLHCMISCAITGTPCIVLDNLSGKVVGVYEWIKELEYIKIVEECNEVIDNNLYEWNEIGKNHIFLKEFSEEFYELQQIIQGEK